MGIRRNRRGLIVYCCHYVSSMVNDPAAFIIIFFSLWKRNLLIPKPVGFLHYFIPKKERVKYGVELRESACLNVSVNECTEYIPLTYLYISKKKKTVDSREKKMPIGIPVKNSLFYEKKISLLQTFCYFKLFWLRNNQIKYFLVKQTVFNGEFIWKSQSN